ncbi:MAG: DUF3891 family protein [Acidobacteriota bacterium]
MIVYDLGKVWRVITQHDHAALSAELLSLWRADGLPGHPRREDLLFAVREHDNGWLEADSSPRCRADGRPHDFISVPAPWRREIWRRGVFRHVAERPYSALLIAQHALALHRRQAEREDWRASVEAWEALREELLEQAGAQREEMLADYRFLALADSLSLAVCAGFKGSSEIDGWRYSARLEADRLELALDPFPLAGATTLEIACRDLEAGSYGGDVELSVALASCRWRRVPVRLVPLKTP